MFNTEYFLEVSSNIISLSNLPISMQLIKEENTNSTMIHHHRASTISYSTPSPINPSINPTNTTTTTINTLVDNTTINNNNSNVIASTRYVVNNNMNLQWHSEFPPGYRFCPKDGELIYYYLQRKILNLKLPHNKIKDIDLYATTPDKLSEEYEPVGENEWYFFTPRDRKYKNGLRPNRATNRVKGGSSDGYWKATGADKDIFHPYQEKEVIGHKKALVFYEGKSPKGKKTNWIMHEFRVTNITTRKRLHDDDMRLDDCVLCKIYNKSDKSLKDDINLEINNEIEQVKEEEVEAEAEEEEELVAKEEKLPPGEDQFLYNPHYIYEDAIGLFQTNNPEIFYSHHINQNEFDRIVKKDNYPPQLPDHHPYTFTDKSQLEMQPIYDDFYRNEYQHGFEDPEKRPFLPSMPPLSYLQRESSGDDEHSPTFFDHAELNYKYIDSSNNGIVLCTTTPSGAHSAEMDVDVVID